MKRTWIIITFIIVAVIGILYIWGNNKESSVVEQKTVRIAYLPITHALPVFAVKELETSDSPVQVELVKYGSWPELMDALNTGKVDGATALVELGVKAREQGIDVRAVALGHKEGNIIITNNDIHSAQDLKGKTFAIPHKQSSHNILAHLMLEKAGLTTADVKIVEMSPPEMPAALAVGQIAGYTVAEPFGSLAIALNRGTVFDDPQALWHDNICCALLLNGTFVDTHPDLAKAFTKAYIDAGIYLDEHPEEQERIAKQYMKFDEQVIKRSLEVISYKDLALTESLYGELVNHMKQQGLITTAPAYEEFVDTSLLP
ncbi:ABC transporter substrate-binding protein [Veillonella agrestimuris]|uniref:ABC transporter substrate-binding protein n=1 Tax=Veillonella agrestimuris TaxID=2941340 RepID=UPI0020415021|nr:ABC transporter substrate-binding protein [Veillonella agrestimuris]